MEQVSITSAYMWAIVIMVAFFLLAVINQTIPVPQLAEFGFGFSVLQLVSLDL